MNETTTVAEADNLAALLHMGTRYAIGDRWLVRQPDGAAIATTRTRHQADTQYVEGGGRGSLLAQEIVVALVGDSDPTPTERDALRGIALAILAHVGR